jgi:hypothetical protein
MAKKKLQQIKDDEVSLYDVLLAEIDGFTPKRKNELIQVMLMLLACAEGEKLNMMKVAALVERLSDGQMKFSG